MKKFLLLCLVFVGPLAYAQDMRPPAVPQAPAMPTTFISNGERVPIPDAGFSMVPPVGWEVMPTNSTGASLLFQAPKPPGSTKEFTYQANIRVMAFFDKPTAIDDIAKEEWSKVITEKMSAISNRTTEFALLSAEKVQLQSGIDAILFYSSFRFDESPMMQMHILVSNAKNTFLMSYTDFAKVFEQQGSPALQTAYGSMYSAEVDSQPAPRFQSFIFAGAGVLAFFVLLLLLRFIRGRRIAKMADNLDDYDGGSESSYKSSVSMVTEVDSRSHVSEYVERSGKSSKSRRAPVEEDEADDEGGSYSVVEESEDVRSEHSYRPAPPPAPKKERSAPPPPKAPAPPPAASSSVTKSSSSRPSAPAPAPKDRFENRKRKDSTVPPSVQTAPSASQTPVSVAANEMPETRSRMPVSEVAPATEGAWNLYESQGDDDVPLSDVMPDPESHAETPDFTKRERTKSSDRSKRVEVREESEVARLSEILPHTGGGEESKKKGLFGLFSKKEAEKPKAKMKEKSKSSRRDIDDEIPVSGVSDAWAMDSKKSVGKSKGRSDEGQPKSEVVNGWNLDEDSSDDD